MIPELRALYRIDEVEFLCVGSLSMTAVELQIQLAASASVHVMPHGGLSYLAMFASEGAGVLLLTNDGYAKEWQVLGRSVCYLPQATVDAAAAPALETFSCVPFNATARARAFRCWGSVYAGS